MAADLPRDHVRPPRVTIVLINRNYAAYVGAAIDSILAQDYPALEAIVVDNGSTDDSRRIIAEHVGDDPRFRVIHLDRNLGQLGAFFHVFDEINGRFVTILDADDVLVSNYVSSHVQAHIALRRAVAFTSSNVYEMDADGRAITGGYWPFAADQDARVRHLPDADTVPRLATVSDRDYRLLARATATIPVTESGWFWAPGTANMYRRSVLDLTRQPQRSDGTYLHGVDAYLNPFCHGLGGSALIHLPLSGYRVHDGNDFAVRESVNGMSTGRPEIKARNERLNCETIEWLMRDAKRFVAIVGAERFWGLIDHISVEPHSRRLLSLPYVQNALVDNYVNLKEVFGELGLVNGLIPRMRSRDLRAVLRGAHGGHIPFRLQLRVLRKSVKRIIGQKSKSQSPGPRKPRDRAKQLWQRLTGAPPEIGGPVAGLSHDPPVFWTGIAYDKFVGIAAAFGKRFGNIPAGFIVYPTWTIEDRAEAIAAAAAEHRHRFGNHRLQYVCNTQREADLLKRAEQPAIFLNKNFTVSETVFRPLAEPAVEFDAVYNAQFVRYKRHKLAAKIARVAYISYVTVVESPQQQRRRLAATLARNPAHVLLNPLADGLPIRIPHKAVNAGINRAAVGLCLSAAEGTNNASMEYMLAGLPVVSTPSIGGRDVYFDPEYCLICEPDPGAVRDAVETLKARKLPREYIRARTLAKIEPQRRRFLALADDMIASLGGERRFVDGRWPFGESSGIVTWNTFENHLRAFDHAAAIALANRANDTAVPTITAADIEGTQLQFTELSPIIKAIKSRPQCALLVFGCGNDSALWERVNCDGTTAFIEDDARWLEVARSRLINAEVHPVSYGTRQSDWRSLLDAPERLALDLPQEVRSRRWDVVLVDGPAGFEDSSPGRMKSIYAASRLVAPGGCVFVHDCDRPAEQQFAERYLGNERLFVRAKGRAVLNGYAF